MRRAGAHPVCWPSEACIEHHRATAGAATPSSRFGTTRRGRRVPSVRKLKCVPRGIGPGCRVDGRFSNPVVQNVGRLGAAAESGGGHRFTVSAGTWASTPRLLPSRPDLFPSGANSNLRNHGHIGQWRRRAPSPAPLISTRQACPSQEDYSRHAGQFSPLPFEATNELRRSRTFFRNLRALADVICGQTLPEPRNRLFWRRYRRQARGWHDGCQPHSSLIAASWQAHSRHIGWLLLPFYLVRMWFGSGCCPLRTRPAGRKRTRTQPAPPGTVFPTRDLSDRCQAIRGHRCALCHRPPEPIPITLGQRGGLRTNRPQTKRPERFKALARSPIEC